MHSLLSTIRRCVRLVEFKANTQPAEAKSFDQRPHDKNNMIDYEREGGLEIVAFKIENYSVSKHAEVANFLLNEGLENHLLDNLHKFRCLDAKVAEQMVEKGLGKQVVMYVRNFIKISRATLDALLSEGLEFEIAYELDLLPLDIENKPLTANNGELIPLTAEHIKYYADCQRYKGLRLALLHLSPKQRIELFPWNSQSAVSAQLGSLFKEHDWHAAAEFVSCLELMGYKVDDELAKLVQEKDFQEVDARLEQESKRPGYQLNVDIVGQLILFYSNSLIEHEKMLLKQKHTKNDQELGFAKKVALLNIDTQSKTDTQFLFEWFKSFLIEIIANEMSTAHNADKNVPNLIPSSRFSSTLEFIKCGTEEELRNYLREAQVLFSGMHINWNLNYGGDEWSGIAKLALEMWNQTVQDQEKVVWIDRAFQIEHKNDNILSKIPRPAANFVSENLKVRRLLDEKFKAVNVVDFIKEARLIVGDHKVFKTIEQRYQAWRKIKESPTRGIGTD